MSLCWRCGHKASKILGHRCSDLRNADTLTKSFRPTNKIQDGSSTPSSGQLTLKLLNGIPIAGDGRLKTPECLPRQHHCSRQYRCYKVNIPRFPAKPTHLTPPTDTGANAPPSSISPPTPPSPSPSPKLTSAPTPPPPAPPTTLAKKTRCSSIMPHPRSQLLARRRACLLFASCAPNSRLRIHPYLNCHDYP